MATRLCGAFLADRRARTEELRGLEWSHVVAYDQERQAWRPVGAVGWEHEEFAVYVWRSVRASGVTKTPKSRRTLKLSQRCVPPLAALWEYRNGQTDGLVFATRAGAQLGAGNVRREFRRVIARAGLEAEQWTPREMRHSFVSVLSDRGVPIEHISRLVGHKSTTVTEKVYRQQIRPVMDEGATAMDRIFPELIEEPPSGSWSGSGRFGGLQDDEEAASMYWKWPLTLPYSGVGDTGFEPVASSV
jgi:integrase